MIYYNADLTKRFLLDGPGNVMLACSGGVDSIAGSHFLISHLRKRIEFTILHINNHLHTDEEAADRVYDFARSVGVPAIIRSAPVNESNGIEASCREARFKIYQEIGGTIILFHHLDDAVESYLMNCFRGKHSFIPMPQATPIEDGTLIRPFIPYTSKTDFVSYAAKHDLRQWVTVDPLNAKSRRGWIRSTLLPTIEQEYPGLSKTIKKMYLKKAVQL
jgi:tRNA(Ile)-lysidine synthase TilS/MesJ